MKTAIMAVESLRELSSALAEPNANLCPLRRRDVPSRIPERPPIEQSRQEPIPDDIIYHPPQAVAVGQNLYGFDNHAEGVILL